MNWPLWLVVALCAVVVGWMGAVAFHHFRIRHLLSDLRADAERYHPPDIRKTPRVFGILEDLERHGCRTLPVLIDEFHPDAPSGYLAGLSDLLSTLLFNALREDTPEQKWEMYRMLRDLEVQGGDPPEELHRKCEALHRWWAKEGPTYHQSWRFWSTNCRAR